MKQRILSLALSGLLAMGTVFGLAACKPKTQSGNGGGNGTIDQSNGQNSGQNNGSSIKPGTVITDETLKSSIFSALSEAQLPGFTYTAGVNIGITEGGKTSSQKISAEGAALFEKKAEADLSLSIEGGEAPLYLLGFLREEGAYSVTGEAEEEVDFAALKQSLKAEDDPLILEKGETGPLQAILAAPVTVKLLKNATALFEGVVKKTEGGYSLTFDLFGGAEKLLQGFEAVAEVIDNTAELTLSGLLGQKQLSGNLETLFKGITAEELLALKQFLPQEVQEKLPTPGKEGALDYLLGLLRSGKFYTDITGSGEQWTGHTTFGEVPLATFLSNITGGEVDLSSLKLKEFLHTFTEYLAKKAVSALAEVLSLSGEVSGEEVELSLEFSFDESKALIGLTIDALANGMLAEAAEPQPDGGEQPEDGNGDEMTAAESGTGLRMSAKLAATVAKAPELFSLTGCRYQGSDGPVTIK